MCELKIRLRLEVGKVGSYKRRNRFNRKEEHSVESGRSELHSLPHKGLSRSAMDDVTKDISSKIESAKWAGSRIEAGITTCSSVGARR